MFICCVSIWVKPEYRQEFIDATKENASASQKEPGNLRFDVLECLDNSNEFFLYEVYKSEEDMNTHKRTSHYKKWRDTVEDMMAKPRVGVKHKSIFPINEKDFVRLDYGLLEA
ncbi:MAG: putative quinol monooxygenase [Candidatus Thorarchaeota archaeon]